DAAAAVVAMFVALHRPLPMSPSKATSPPNEWRKLSDHFTSENHLKRSRSSKVNRSKQLYSSNQGTKSYAQSRYEEFNEETGVFPDFIDHFRAKHMEGANGTAQWPKRDT
ncbi:LOR/SDH bifunctional enzyme, conserved domain-containing protein, partial [Tanacetum coccineum]